MSDDLESRIRDAIARQEKEESELAQAERVQQGHTAQAVRDAGHLATRLAVEVVQPRMQIAQRAIPRAQQVHLQPADEGQSASVRILGEDKQFPGTAVMLYIEISLSQGRIALRSGISRYDAEQDQRGSGAPDRLEKFQDSDEDRSRMAAWIDDELERLSPRFAGRIQ